MLALRRRPRPRDHLLQATRQLRRCKIPRGGRRGHAGPLARACPNFGPGGLVTCAVQLVKEGSGIAGRDATGDAGKRRKGDQGCKNGLHGLFSLLSHRRRRHAVVRFRRTAPYPPPRRAPISGAGRNSPPFSGVFRARSRQRAWAAASPHPRRVEALPARFPQQSPQGATVPCPAGWPGAALALCDAPALG
jgi:hypothetical protein